MLLAAASTIPRPADQWTALLATGDRLSKDGGTAWVGPSLVTARTAYLLAFHQAQDAGDRQRVLIVATRLDRLGEDALAAHVRRAAQDLHDR
jgi:hypothetical protein